MPHVSDGRVDQRQSGRGQTGRPHSPRAALSDLSAPVHGIDWNGLQEILDARIAL